MSLTSKLLFNGAKQLTLRTLSLDGNAESKDSEPIKLNKSIMMTATTTTATTTPAAASTQPQVVQQQQIASQQQQDTHVAATPQQQQQQQAVQKRGGQIQQQTITQSVDGGSLTTTNNNIKKTLQQQQSQPLPPPQPIQQVVAQIPAEPKFGPVSAGQLIEDVKPRPAAVVNKPGVNQVDQTAPTQIKKTPATFQMPKGKLSQMKTFWNDCRLSVILIS